MTPIERDIKLRRILKGMIDGSPLSVEAVAADLQISASLLYNALNPNMAPKNSLTAERVMRITELTGNLNALTWMALQHGCRLTRIQTELATPDDLRARALRVAREMGELADRIEGALSDGVVDRTEWTQIEKEALDVATELSEIGEPEADATRPGLRAVGGGR
jgi:hypothetical protein